MKYFALLLLFLLLLSNLAFSQDEESFTYMDKGRRDPFMPLVDKTGRYVFEKEELYSFTDLELAGILWDPDGNSTALINNEIVGSGDSIYGFLVEDIKKNSVIVSKDGLEYTLWLSEIEEGL